MPIKSLKSAGIKALGQGLGADAEPTDPEFNQTTLLLHADGSEGVGNTAKLGDPDYKAFKDNSTSAYTITVQGDAYGNSFSPYTLADGYWSTTFNGNSDNHIRYQGYRENDSFNLDDRNKWCVDFWIFVFDNAVAYQRVAEMYDSAGYWAIKFNSTANGKLCIGATDTADNGILSTADAIPENQWVHIALTNDGDRLRWLVDGQLSAVSASGWTQPWSNNTSTTSHSQIQLGNYRSVNGYQLRGSLNNFRIVQGSIPSEFETTSTTLDTTIFSKPTAPTADPYTDGKLSVHLDGNGDYLEVPATTDHDFGTGDFTVEFWLYPNETLGWHLFLSAPQNTTTQIGYDTGNGARYLYFYNGANIISGTGATSLVAFSWNHVALVREGTTISLFSNGNRVGTATHSSNVSFSNLNIGRYHAGGYDMISHMSSVRLIKGTAIYDVSSTTYTVPTEPLTTTSQGATASEVKLLTCQSKSFVDNSSEGHAVKPINQALVSEFHPFDDGYWSVNFDGSGDKLTTSADIIDLNTSSFTAELWFNQTGNGSFSDTVGNTLLIIGASSLSNAIWLTISNSGVPQARIRYNGSSWETTLNGSGSAISLNKWHHIALVKNTSDSNSVKLFVNGSLVASGTNSTDLTSFGQKVGIGGQVGAGRNFNGRISNCRVVVGSALYTSTFSPSTSPFTTTSQSATSSEVKLLTCQSNRFIDNSSSGHALTVNGDPVVDDNIPFRLLSRQTKLLTCRSSTHQDIIPDRYNYSSGVVVSASTPVPFISSNNPFSYTSPDNVGSGFFDGNGDYINLNAGQSRTSLTLDGEFTFEAWIYIKETSDFIIDTCPTSGATDQYLRIRYDNTNDRVQWWEYSSATLSSDTDSVQPKTWCHIALVRNNDNVVKWFINGVEQSTTTTNSNQIECGDARPMIGADGYNNGGANWFNGYIADINIIKASTKYSTNFAPPTSTISADTNTNLLTCQYSGAVRNKGFLDDSKYNHRVERYGNAHMGTFSPFSLEDQYWSVYFNGNYLNIPDSSDFTFGSNNFSIAVWVYRTDTSASTERGIANTGGTSYTSWLFTTKKFWGTTTGSSWNIQINYSQDVPLHQWVYVQVNRVGNVYTAYHDGVSVGTTTVSGSLYNNSSAFELGFRQGASSMVGYMSNFIMTNGSNLSSTNIPTEPFTADSNTKLLCLQSNRYIDNSNSGHTITLRSTNTSIVPFSPFAPSRSYSKNLVGGSLLVNPTSSDSGDYLTIDDDGSFNPKDGDFSIEFWVYPTSFQASNGNNYFSRGQASSVGTNFISIQANNNTGFETTLGVFIGSGSPVITSTEKLKIYSWHFVLLKRVGTTLTLVINGVSKTATNSTNIVTGTNPFVSIGAQTHTQTAPDRQGHAYIANTRYMVGSASSQSGVPTAPLTDSTDTVLLLNYMNAGLIDHTMKHNLETVNNTRIRTDVKKYGTGSIYFDGTGDVLIQEQNRLTFNFGTGEFTIEFWCLVPSDASTGQLQLLMSSEGGSWSSGAISYYLVYTATHQFPIFIADYHGSSPMLSAVDNLRDGNWHHHAVVRGTSGACAYFLDGTRKSTATFTGNVGSSSRDMVFGGLSSSSRNAEFFLDDLRVTKGVARYDPSQTSVTIPTQAFANK